MITNNNIAGVNKLLRLNTIKTVFDHFDNQILNLTTEKRLEKYNKMAENTFRFFRGSSALFFMDITKANFPFATPQSSNILIQGDLHFENFGIFKNAHNELTFDVNDFDEAYIGSYLHDIMRMCVSILIIGEMQNYNENEQYTAIAKFLKAYYKKLKDFVGGDDNPNEFYLTKKNTDATIKNQLKKLAKKSANDYYNKVLHKKSKVLKFIENDEFVKVNKETETKIKAIWTEYLKSLISERRDYIKNYKIRDIVIKNGSGTASIGLDRFYMLIEKPLPDNNEEDRDNAILEIKEARNPVPAYFLPYNKDFWNTFNHNGKRVVFSQTTMQHHVDPYLGYVSITDKEYYIRQRSPFKKKIKLNKLKDVNDFYCTVISMGEVTAKIHSRANLKGITQVNKELEILKAIGKDVKFFIEQISLWTINYKKQVDEDYNLFQNYINNI